MSREALKHIALVIAGLIAVWGMFVMGWCAIQKIYIDVPMLLVLSNIVTGIASSITTLLVGRTLAQLNQPADGETTMTQTTQTVTKPKISADDIPVPVKIANPISDPAKVQEVKP